jgi:nitroreductase
MSNPLIQLMQNRISSPRLMAPAPSTQVLDNIYQCALRAPDHMMLRPWRYLVIEEAAREELGELFADSAAKLEGELAARQLEKYRAMPLRAPMMLIAISCNVDHPKVPVEEQVLSCGAGVAYMLLALQAEGFGGIWRTGPLAENAYLKSALKLEARESIVGFLYLGTPCGEPKSVPSVDVEAHFETWRP